MAPDGPIGILSAMPQEVSKLKENVTDQQEHKFGIFSFTTGTLEGKPVVFAFSNIGTVFCASVATTMCNHFNVRCILFTGVAGGAELRRATSKVGKFRPNLATDIGLISARPV